MGAFDLDNQPVQPLPGQSYSITLTYQQEDVPSGVDEAELALYYWDGSRWVRESTSVVIPEINTIIATPIHFSFWAVLAENSETGQIFLPVILKE